MRPASPSPLRSAAWLAPAELALRWNVTLRTLDRWRAAGRGPAWHRFGRGIRYHIDDLAAHEAQHRHKGD